MAAAKASAKKKPAPEATPADGAAEKVTVQDVHAQAARLLEAVAIMRAVADEIVPRFYPQPHTSHPELLLRRVGEGARSAHVDAIVNADIAIRKAADVIEQQGRALLEVVLDLGERRAPEEKGRLALDEVVHLKDVKDEFAYASSVSCSVAVK